MCLFTVETGYRSCEKESSSPVGVAVLAPLVRLAAAVASPLASRWAVASMSGMCELSMSILAHFLRSVLLSDCVITDFATRTYVSTSDPTSQVLHSVVAALIRSRKKRASCCALTVWFRPNLASTRVQPCTNEGEYYKTSRGAHKRLARPKAGARAEGRRMATRECGGRKGSDSVATNSDSGRLSAQRLKAFEHVPYAEWPPNLKMLKGRMVRRVTGASKTAVHRKAAGLPGGPGTATKMSATELGLDGGATPQGARRPSSDVINFYSCVRQSPAPRNMQPI